MDDPYKSSPRRQTRGILTLELAVAEGGGERQALVLVSMPRSEGIYTRSWPLRGVQTDAALCADLMAWISSAVRNAFVTQGGVQEVLLPVAGE